MNDLISIIIPIYKVEAYLQNCLDSIQKQTYSNFEVLLINDGSPDHPEEICQNFVRLDNRYKYFYKENGGVSTARNLGIDNSKGDHIVFVDADDSIDPNFLQSFVENYENNKTLVISDFTRVGAGYIKKSFLEYKNILIPIDKFIFEKNALIGYPFNKFFNNNLIKQNNLYFVENQSIREDVIFYYDYLKLIEYVKIIEESTYNYYYREGSAVSKKHNFSNFINIIVSENRFIDHFNFVPTETFTDNYSNIFFVALEQLVSSSRAEYNSGIRKLKDVVRIDYIRPKVKRFNILKLLFKFKTYSVLHKSYKHIVTK